MQKLKIGDCANFQVIYQTRKKRILSDIQTLRSSEHIRNTKAFKKGSDIATHTWLNDHSIDFNRAHVPNKGNFRVRKTLESWHTAITQVKQTIMRNNNNYYYPVTFNWFLFSDFIVILHKLVSFAAMQ